MVNLSLCTQAVRNTRGRAKSLTKDASVVIGALLKKNKVLYITLNLQLNVMK